jgi:carboxypeptidase Q
MQQQSRNKSYWCSIVVALGASVAISQAQSSHDDDAISRIRDEGMNHSQAMETLSYLTDVIGPRLTASPNLKRANEWTRDKLAEWGLTNAHLEAWGPFGRGWSLKRFSAQVVEPQTIPLISYPNAWSPGFEAPITADVVYFNARTNGDLDNFKGKLEGKIVLNGQPRELQAHFEPLALRLMETNLLQLANAGETRGFGGPFGGGGPRGGRAGEVSGGGTNSTRSGAGPEGRRGAFAGRGRGGARFLAFIASEKPALVVTPSSIGDGGTIFVAEASVPTPENAAPFSFTNRPRPWSTNAPEIPPQITVAAEDYNRMVRMIEHGEKLKMAVDLKVQFHDEDLMAYNTVAEIPGKDLKDEIVMLGAHMDSWHSGTGATDNGVGVAATMEAMRILAALDLHPRRTIRIGLWSGEEEGLLGSRAYVARHFGYFTNMVENTVIRSPKDSGGDQPVNEGSTTNRSSSRHVFKLREYEKLSAYFNLDNGNGKIRGVYMEGNEAVRPIFRKWLEPFRDLDASTLTLSRTGGTDHQSFDAIGLPAFQFIQDPLEYRSRTHHSNEDVYDRIQAEDLKQTAVILAAFAYDAAMADEKVPRKPVD